MICSAANRFLAMSTSLDPAEFYHRGWIPMKGAGHFLHVSFFRRFLHTVKGRAFGSPLARASYPRASTAEVDPRSW